MTGATRWRCRPYRDGDEEPIVDIFERAFGRPASVAQWRWKLGARSGDLDNVWVAVDTDDRPLSHYGGMPRRLRIGGREHVVMVVADAMTAPEAQRQGAFTTLARRAHRAWREAGVSLVIGMPNERHGSTIEAIGWRRLSTLRWAIRPLQCAALLRRHAWIGRLPGSNVAERLWNGWYDRDSESGGIRVEPADEAACRDVFAAVGSTAPGPGRLALDRDPEWLAHRLLRGPHARHEILVAAGAGGPAGYCALRVRDGDGRRVGALTEMVAVRDEVLDRLALAAAVRLRQQGAETAITLAVPGGAEHVAVRRRGFRFSWGDFGVYAVPLDDDLDVEALRAAPWMLSGGDFDVL